MKNKKGFTLIELIVVILIVSILAGVAVPLLSAKSDSAKWSEAKAAAGSVVTLIRSYAALRGTSGFVASQVNGSLASGNSNIGLVDGELDGTYFTDNCYVISGASYDASGIDCTITITAANSSRENKPSNPARMILTVTDNAADWSQDSGGGGGC